MNLLCALFGHKWGEWKKSAIPWLGQSKEDSQDSHETEMIYMERSCRRCRHWNGMWSGTAPGIDRN